MTVEVLGPTLDKPVTMRFRPNSWAQQRTLVSPAPEILYSGRYGSSKTRTLAEKLDMRCRMHAGARCVFARKRRTDLGATSLPVLLEQSITPAHRDWGWRPGADGGSTLFYPNGSQILCVGLDNPGKLRSGQYDLACIDQCEEIDEEEWTAISGRMRWIPRPWVGQDGRVMHARRQIIGGCNPDGPGHFLFKRFEPTHSHCLFTKKPIDLPNGMVLPAGSLWAECIMAGGQDNMENLTRDYLARLAMFKGRYYDRYVLGKWVAFEGQVYDCWDPAIHVRRRPQEWVEKWGGYPPPDWPIYRSIDFGYVNPFVCQWWTRSPDNTFWLFQEIYMTKRTVGDHARRIRALERKHLNVLRECERMNAAKERRLEHPIESLNLYTSVSDHDAGDRAVLELEDVYTDRANKDVSSGIQTVYRMMVPFQRADGGLDSRLLICPDSLTELDEALSRDNKPTCTADEVPGYRYVPVRDSTITGTPREEPFKDDDHGLDAMRYLFHTIAEVGDQVAVVY